MHPSSLAKEQLSQLLWPFVKCSRFDLRLAVRPVGDRVCPESAESEQASLKTTVFLVFFFLLFVVVIIVVIIIVVVIIVLVVVVTIIIIIIIIIITASATMLLS